VSWSPGATGGTPTGYFISAGTSPGGSELVDSLPVGNTLSVTGYLAQGTYYARVRAGNAAGYSAYSTEISFRIGARSRPRNPGFLTGSWHNGIVTLSWSRPSGDIEDGPTGYIIEAGSGPGQSDLATVPVGEVTSFQAAGIPAGVYYVRVRAVNELGVGPPSNEIVIQPGLGAGQPLNLRESGVGSMVELTWQAPSTGDPPVGYLLEAGSAPGLADLVVLPLGNVTAFATTAPPGVYYVRVRAVNAWGVAGPASNEVVVRR
jgi:predicted phage tail protein